MKIDEVIDYATIAGMLTHQEFVSYAKDVLKEDPEAMDSLMFATLLLMPSLVYSKLNDGKGITDYIVEMERLVKKFYNSKGESKSLYDITIIAMACHEANRVWCMSEGDYSQKHWKKADKWQRESAIKGVEFRLNNPDAKQDAQHNAWMQDKIKQGWVYGEVKDPEKKTHPCIVPFNELPPFQQKKDELFCAIVDALK